MTDEDRALLQALNSEVRRLSEDLALLLSNSETTRARADESLTTDENTRLKEMREHAWNWFSYHAGQRVNMFNYFLAAAGLLFAGFGATFEKNPLLAAGIAFTGAITSVAFRRLDQRNEQLVSYGKSSLLKIEGVMFRNGGKPQQGVTVRGVDLGAGVMLQDEQAPLGRRSEKISGRHGTHLPFIETLMAVMFALATCLAVHEVVTQRSDHNAERLAEAIESFAARACADGPKASSEHRGKLDDHGTTSSVSNATEGSTPAVDVPAQLTGQDGGKQ